jgi:hypothetical protein
MRTIIPWIGEVLAAQWAPQHPAVSLAGCMKIRKLIPFPFIFIRHVVMNIIAFSMAHDPRLFCLMMHPIACVLALIQKAAPVIKSCEALSGMTKFSPTLGSVKRRVLRAVAETSGTPTFLPLLKTCG